MPAFRLTSGALVALAVALLFAPSARSGPMRTGQPTEPTKPRGATDAEVKFVDDSVLKLKLTDEKLELVTKHGVLSIAVADVRRIEFANRVPADAAEKVLHLIAKLNHPEFKIRESATAELKALGARAYPLVLKAIKHDDPEVGRRADEVVKHIQARVAPALLEARDTDIVHTDDSKFTGRLSAEVLNVQTFQFGEQRVKLADVRTLRAGSGAAGEEPGAVIAQAPGNLSAYQQQFGKELVFAVTGTVPAAGANAGVWGTDLYTLDSNVAVAAVHAGMVKPGETATVRVRIVNSPAQFASSFRNNVNSTAYGNYPNGAYTFVPR
jgi:LCCL domain